MERHSRVLTNAPLVPNNDYALHEDNDYNLEKLHDERRQPLVGHRGQAGYPQEPKAPEDAPQGGRGRRRMRSIRGSAEAPLPP